MAKKLKETDELNKKWVKKQEEIGKTYSDYIIGGMIVLGIVVCMLIYAFS